MDEQTTITLGKQLLACGGMMLAITFVHAFGLVALTKALKLRNDRLKDKEFGLGALGLTSATGVSLLLLHALEIGVFAGLYLYLDAMQTVEEALYYSASAYATLGRTAEYFPSEWRLLGAAEALIGFLMIGWSTAFIVSKASKLMPD